MGQSEFIAALDLGSSKMIAMVGMKNEIGILSVIASEKIDSGSCMRKGYVHNVEEAATKIGLLISKINNKLRPGIEKIYVGVGGQSVHLEIYSSFRQVDGVVDDSVLNSMLKECQAYDPELYEVIEVLSPEYYLDNQLTPNPKGLECRKIEARYKLILGRPLIKRNLRLCVEEKAKIKIAGYFTAPIATAEAVLIDREKELGCALVEFGAGITYVSIYKNSHLKHLVAIPLGGNVITKDVSTLNILENEAETLKLNWGSAVVELDNQVKIEDHPQIKSNELNSFIEARVDEILSNVMEQINVSGFGDALGAGIIITGGGTNLKKIQETIQNKSGMEVRLGGIKKSFANQAVDWINDISNTEIVGLLALGNENCAAPAPVIDNTGQTSLFGSFENKNPIETGSQRGARTMPEEKKSPEEKDKKPVQKPQNKGRSVFDIMKDKFNSMSRDLFEDADSRDSNDDETQNTKK